MARGAIVLKTLTGDEEIKNERISKEFNTGSTELNNIYFEKHRFINPENHRLLSSVFLHQFFPNLEYDTCRALIIGQNVHTEQ